MFEILLNSDLFKSKNLYSFIVTGNKSLSFVLLRIARINNKIQITVNNRRLSSGLK
jgi:hypothetical protein